MSLVLDSPTQIQPRPVRPLLRTTNSRVGIWHAPAVIAKNHFVYKSFSNLAFNVRNAQLSDNGAYTCVVTDTIRPVATVPAQLIIILAQNPLGQTVMSGATVTLSVTNTATLPIGYRWRRGGQFLAGAAFVLNERTSFLTNAQMPYSQSL